MTHGLSRDIISRMVFRMVFLLAAMAASPAFSLDRNPALADEEGFLTIAQPPLEIRYHPEAESFAREVLERSRTFLSETSSLLGIPAKGPYAVIIVQGQEEMERLQPEGYSPPEWAAALAYPQIGVVFLLSPGSLRNGAGDYWQVLHHEMVHLVVGGAAAGREARIPHWLEEGIATYLAGEMGLPRLLHLTWAQITGNAPSFKALEGEFPSGSSQAEVAYAQSYLMVQYLGKRFGRGAVGKLLNALLRERDLPPAVERAFGVKLEDLMAGFQDYSHLKATWIPVLTSTGTIWGLTAALFLVSYLRRRGRDAKLKREWAEEEAWEDHRHSGGAGEETTGKPTLH